MIKLIFFWINSTSEDFLNWAKLQSEYIEFFSEVYNQSLSDLTCWVQALNNTVTHFGIQVLDEKIELHYEIYRETNYDTYTYDQFIIENEFRLVDDLKNAY